jgi:hypothetical protein
MTDWASASWSNKQRPTGQDDFKGCIGTERGENAVLPFFVALEGRNLKSEVRGQK